MAGYNNLGGHYLGGYAAGELRSGATDLGDVRPLACLEELKRGRQRS